MCSFCKLSSFPSPQIARSRTCQPCAAAIACSERAVSSWCRLVEVSEGSVAGGVQEEEGDAGEVYTTPRPFLSRHLLDLTDALQEEAGPPDERFFTPLLRAESSLSGDFSDSGASSLTLGAAWDDQDAATCSTEAGPSQHGGWGERAQQQEGRERQGEAMEHDAGQDRREHPRGDETRGPLEQDAMAEAGHAGGAAEERGEGGAASFVDVSPICAEEHYRTFMLVRGKGGTQAWLASNAVPGKTKRRENVPDKF